MAVPGPFAVTKPLLDTVATLVLLDVQVTTEDALLGVTVAVSCKVSPLLSVADVLLRLIPVAGWLPEFTVITHVALRFEPSAVVAVIVAFPTALAVTSPALLTVAIFVLLDFQVTDVLLALLGVTVAVNCSVSPLLMVADV